jgi:hypothetical protein
MSLRIRCAPLMLIAIAVLSVTSNGASAQANEETPVFVALPETFPDLDARALIVRERGRDVVVLDPDEATAEALTMSLFLLGRVRELHPLGERGQVIPVTGFVMTRPPSAEHRRRIAGTLARLQAAPTTRVGNLGPGRWVRLLER